MKDRSAARAGVGRGPPGLPGAVPQLVERAPDLGQGAGDRSGKLPEVGGHPVGEHREDRDPERLGRLHGHALREDAVHGQAQVTVLLRAPERQHGAVVVPQGLCDDQRKYDCTIEGDEVLVWDPVQIAVIK